MSLAILCAGQGNQHPGMFAGLVDAPAAAAVVAPLCEALGIVPSRLAELDAAHLGANRPVQLLTVGHALAVCAVLDGEGVRADVYAGYSVGELAAHGCAGTWDAATTLALADSRGRLMDAAAAESGVALGMVAVLGLPADTIAALAESNGCAVAIVNGPDHQVVGGPASGIEVMAARAEASGARRVRILPVEVASHTRFLAGAVEPFARALAAYGWKSPDAPVLSGIDGRPVTTGAVASDLLARQIGEPLNWWRCLESVMEYGPRVVLEVGPGHALTRMVTERWPDIPARAIEDFRTVAGAARWLRKAGVR